MKRWLVSVLVVAGSCALGWWIAGACLFVLLLPLSRRLWWISRRVAEIYQNALLTPGLLVSIEPLEFISLANMSSFGGETYAVKRVSLLRLPGFPEEVGTLFPCVSGFQDGPHPLLWGDFDPQPLSFGTGNRKLLQARRSKLGEEAFVQLQKVFDRRLFPRQARQLLWLDKTRTHEIPPPLKPN